MYVCFYPRNCSFTLKNMQKDGGGKGVRQEIEGGMSTFLICPRLLHKTHTLPPSVPLLWVYVPNRNTWELFKEAVWLVRGGRTQGKEKWREQLVELEGEMFEAGNGRTDAGTFYCNAFLHLKPLFALNRDSRWAEYCTGYELYMNDKYSSLWETRSEHCYYTVILLFFLQ